MNMKWKRNEVLINEPIVDYLERLFDEEIAKGYTLKVSVGTDSAKFGGIGKYKFATVIVIETSEDLGGGINVGRGAMVIHTTYVHDFKKKAKEVLNERLLFEVSKSVEAAYEIADILDLYGIKVEIHADINPSPKHLSNKSLQQSIGYILGMGYSFQVKPLSTSASYAADKLC